MKKLLIITVLMLTSAISVFAMEKPKVIMFHMHGCSACKKFMPTFDKMSSKFADKFSFTKEDANSKLADQLGISYVPIVFIMNADKQTKIDTDCLASPGCFENKLQNY